MKSKIHKFRAALIITLVHLLISSSLWAQSPEKMSYQAVIRNSSNALVTNTQVGMQISIIQGSASGTAVYVETQTPTTNANGLVSIEIGGGTVVSGDFATIDWANGLYFIKTETDPTGGTNYTIIGTNQLLSVPYALHAKTVESFSSIRVSLSGDTLFFGNDQWVIIPNVSFANEAKITTTDIANITDSSATCGGTITSDGKVSIIAQGVCWSTSQNPTINNSHTNDGNTGGTFTSSITGLIPNTIYYIKAYITNKNGTYYGNQKILFTSNNGFFVDTLASNKNVLLEIYTGNNASYDPDAHRKADSLVNVYGNNKLFLIKIHGGSFAQDYVTPVGSDLTNYFQISSYPLGVLNRDNYNGTSYGKSRTIWGDLVSSTIANPAYVNVAAITVIDTNTRKLTCSVQAYFTANSSVSTNYINIALTQDSIWGNQSGATNFYPEMYDVNTGKYKHNHMLRTLITSVNGESIPANTSGTLYTKSFTYDIPTSISNENIVFENLNIIVFVTENTPNNASASVVPRVINVNKSTIIFK